MQAKVASLQCCGKVYSNACCTGAGQAMVLMVNVTPSQGKLCLSL